MLSKYGRRLASFGTAASACAPLRRGSAPAAHAITQLLTCRSISERQLKRKLEQAGVAYRGTYRAEGRRGVEIRARQTELSMVEEIEALRAEVQPHAFARQQEVLDERKICVHEIRA